MSNPSKDKGTKGETAAVRWFRENGFGGAERQPLRGSRDAGDIALCPGIVVEVKAHRLPASGHPTAAQLTEWMRQTEAERETARADVGILVVKRQGTTNVGRWHAYVTAWTLAELVNDTSRALVADETVLAAPVCLDLADLVAILRGRGWGDDPEEWRQ